MSFYPQPDKYRCGPFALKYSLVMLGIFKHEDEIALKAGSNWWAGTDEIGLSKAAKSFKCKMDYFQSSNPSDARRELNKNLKKNYPCILSINNWEHWISVINYSKGKYVLMDSELEKVMKVVTPSQLQRLWKYKDYYTGVISYDAYVLKPKFKVLTKAKIAPSKAETLMKRRMENLQKSGISTLMI